jgi:hypothetical protein
MLNNVALGPLVEMALEAPPDCQDKTPVLLYVSSSHLETQATFTEDITTALWGRLIDEGEYLTDTGWTVVFKHFKDAKEADAFRNAANQRSDYLIVEQWREYALKRKEDIPKLIAMAQALAREQTRH